MSTPGWVDIDGTHPSSTCHNTSQSAYFLVCEDHLTFLNRYQLTSYKPIVTLPVLTLAKITNRGCLSMISQCSSPRDIVRCIILGTRTDKRIPTRKKSASGRTVLVATSATREIEYTRHVHPSMTIERVSMYDVSS